jgi:hypothetical protein
MHPILSPLGQLEELALRSAIGKPLADLKLTERVHEAVRVYEQFLAYKHGGKRVRASRTRSMIDRWGEKEAVRRTVTNLDMSAGLELLAKYDRLDLRRTGLSRRTCMKVRDWCAAVAYRRSLRRRSNERSFRHDRRAPIAASRACRMNR